MSIFQCNNYAALNVHGLGRDMQPELIIILTMHEVTVIQRSSWIRESLLYTVVLTCILGSPQNGVGWCAVSSKSGNSRFDVISRSWTAVLPKHCRHGNDTFL